MLLSLYEGIKFVPCDLNAIFTAVFVDAGFGENPNSSSQLGFLITLTDNH